MASWKEWKKDFMRGKLILAYILFGGVITSIVGFILFRGNVIYSYVFLVGTVAQVGVLVDTTAHLFLGKITEGLSALSEIALLKDFFRGRTHVDYAVLASFGAGLVGVIYFNGDYVSMGISVLLLFLSLAEFVKLVEDRYYH